MRETLLRALAGLATPDRADPDTLPEALHADLCTVRTAVQRADRERRASAMAEQIRSQLQSEGLSVAELLAALTG